MTVIKADDIVVGSLWYFDGPMFMRIDKHTTECVKLAPKTVFCIVEIRGSEDWLRMLKVLSSEGNTGWLFCTWLVDYLAIRILP